VVVRANAGQGVTLSTTPGGIVNFVANGCGYDQIASFTASGCLTIADGDPTVYSAEYLVIAGGGGGGKSSTGAGGGGGGAGGYRISYSCACSSSLVLGAGCYSVTIGSGGAGSTGSPSPKGSPGTDSTFSTITSTAGGAGGGYSGYSTAGPDGIGDPGGSGGGAGAPGLDSNPLPGGTGNQPPVSPPQGNSGGALDTSQGVDQPAGAGGGGAGGAGSSNANPTFLKGGVGGAGRTSGITGSCVARGGGGGGGGSYNGGTPIPGPASDGGGAGGSGSVGTAGTANTGGGGGGGGGNCTPYNGGNGGSGIVVVRFPSAVCIAAAPGTNTITNCVGPANDKVATFTVTGTLTVS
jgi:hypothetical protein